jgi:hypothetical protein
MTWVIGDQVGQKHIQAINALTELVFLDTNVLMYAAQRVGSQVNKKMIAIEILRTENFGTSGQVLAELFANLTKKGVTPLTKHEALSWVRQLARKPCQAIDAAVVEAAITLSLYALSDILLGRSNFSRGTSPWRDTRLYRGPQS